MSKTAFVLTAGVHVFEGSFMPIVIATGESKEAILSFHRTYTLQGKLTNIKEINLNHYTLEISLGNAQAPIIHAKGKRSRADLEEAIEHFQILYPTAQIRVIQFKDAFLFKQCAGIRLGIDAAQGGKKWLN
ncbi:hypothetical protein AO053_04185 [Haemophilus influenzae biotype aegyptius]|uniref:Uncharacterized protein n=2 Tax=Haemophilus TaxID=724 RepID=A0ABY1VVN0_HAEAE|nr:MULTISPECIES: hypothetical protein [Haemophilus]EGF16794.1 hypothetical protein HMPREF9095_1125 [Haemophilus aegyptius ATCC 11116]OBX82307.1 hypothetical protein A9520_03115 [Haemophilus aegyptius]QEQ58866.1 hypothetical protein F1541_07195 [Haemophilus influenzae biotype aegyptius]QEQ59382.1 hypothetical protein F1540_00070 [Haemophilus influenzae biotype aegyptius]QEQ59640.1 hypothetical protein F1540_01710 [Haemophilus influenzae biotype aegyptius]